MLLICHSCYATSSLESYLEMLDAREAMKAIAEIPAGMDAITLRYCGLFRSGKRSVAWKRVASIIGELTPMMRDAHVRRNGRDWTVPLVEWQEAISMLLDPAQRPKNLTLPLKDNNYLLAILVNRAESAEAKAESKRENERRGATPIGGQAPKPPQGDSLQQSLASRLWPWNQPGVVPLNGGMESGLVDQWSEQPVQVRDLLPESIRARMRPPEQIAADRETAETGVDRVPVRIIKGPQKGKAGALLRQVGTTCVVAITLPRKGEVTFQIPEDHLEKLV